MMKVISKILKIALLIFLAILPILACGVFILIYCCKSGNKMDTASWATLIGGAIGYYGSLILGLIAVYQNIKQRESDAESQQRLENINDKLLIHNETISNETARKTVLPFIGLTHIHYEKYSTSIFASNDSENEPIQSKNSPAQAVAYEELDIKYYCAQIEMQGISFYRKETTGVKDFKNNIGKTQELTRGVIALVQREDAYLPLLLKNIGLNAAVNFSFSFFKEGFNTLPWAFYILPKNLLANDEIRIDIYVPDKSKVIGKYILQLNYYDIFNNQYQQMFELYIRENTVEFSLAHNQTLISSENQNKERK